MGPKYIALVNIDCDEAVAGIVYTWLYRKFTGFVRLFEFDDIIYSIKDIVVVVFVSDDWETLVETKRRCEWGGGVYACGVCLGPVPQPLTELPNFTIHSGDDIVGGLLYDVDVAFKGKNIG